MRCRHRRRPSARRERHGAQAAQAQLAAPEVAEEVALAAPIVAEAVVEAPVAIAVATREEAPAAEVGTTQAATREVVVHTVPTVERKGTTSTYVYLLESVIVCTYCYSHRYE